LKRRSSQTFLTPCVSAARAEIPDDAGASAVQNSRAFAVVTPSAAPPMLPRVRAPLLAGRLAALLARAPAVAGAPV
jgi:hypothetical protein